MSLKPFSILMLAAVAAGCAAADSPERADVAFAERAHHGDSSDAMSLMRFGASSAIDTLDRSSM